MVANLIQILEGTALACVCIFLIVRLRGQRDEYRKMVLLQDFPLTLLKENPEAWKAAVVCFLYIYRGWHTPMEIASFFGLKEKILNEAIAPSNGHLLSAICALIEGGVLKTDKNTESVVLWNIALKRKKKTPPD